MGSGEDTVLYSLLMCHVRYGYFLEEIWWHRDFLAKEQSVCFHADLVGGRAHCVILSYSQVIVRILFLKEAVSRVCLQFYLEKLFNTVL